MFSSLFYSSSCLIPAHTGCAANLARRRNDEISIATPDGTMRILWAEAQLRTTNHRPNLANQSQGQSFDLIAGTKTPCANLQGMSKDSFRVGARICTELFVD